MSDCFSMYVIYFRPLDHPDRYVVRLWEIQNGKSLPTERFWLADTLEWARQIVHKQTPYLVKVPRHPQDEPQIVEVWL